MSVHFSSGKDDWETPDDLFERWNDRYHFVLDAAANDSNRKCDAWFGPGGVAEDALVADWDGWLSRGNIWLNPPYSRGLQSAFVRRAVEAALYGVRWDNHVVCLLPARTDTKLFHEVVQPFATMPPDELRGRHSGAIQFLRGRLKFKGPGGIATNPAPFPSMIVVF